MKRILAAALFVAGTSTAWAADPVEGTWESPTNEDGASIQVQIAPCGGSFCGTITNVKGGDQSIKGERMLWDMAAKGGGTYSGGKVWAPDDDKTYRGKLELSGNSLKISGCVLGGAVCRGETFARVN